MPENLIGLFVADENFDFNIIRALRVAGFRALSIAEQSPSIADADVLAYAVEQEAVLLTEDKDFGELVYRPRLPHRGILLVRLLKVTPAQKKFRVLDTLQNHAPELKDAFAVLGDDNPRIKSPI